MARRASPRIRLIMLSRTHQVAFACVLPVLLFAVAIAFTPEFGDQLRWLGERVSLAWWCVLAIAIAAFGSGYAATERSPRSKVGSWLLAGALASFSVYVFSLQLAYLSDHDDTQTGVRLLWPSAPLAVGLWGLAATTIARETDRQGRPGQRELRGGVAWLDAARRPASVRRGLKTALWLTTLSFAVVGSAFGGLIWRWPAQQELIAERDPWRGYVPQVDWWLQVGYMTWVVGVMGTAALYLWNAFGSRKPDLPRDVRLRARYAQIGGVVALAATVVLSAATLGHVTAEPLLATALAAAGLVYVLLSLDASSRDRPRHVRPALVRRTVNSVLAIVFAVVVAGLASQGDPIVAAPLAGLLAIGLPLGLPFQESLHGIRLSRRISLRQTGPALGEWEFGVSTPESRGDGTSPDSPMLYLYLSAAEADAVRRLLTEARRPDKPLRLELVDHWLAALKSLTALDRQRRNRTGVPLLRVLQMIDGGGDRNEAGSDTTFAPADEVDAVIKELVPVRVTDDLDAVSDERRQTANEWISATAVRLQRSPRDSHKRPTAMEALEAEAVARHFPHDAEPILLAQCQRLVSRRAAYRSARADWRGRETGFTVPDDLRKLRKNRKDNWNQRIAAACRQIAMDWHAQLIAEQRRPRS
jgi:hypothetical protein